MKLFWSLLSFLRLLRVLGPVTAWKLRFGVQRGAGRITIRLPGISAPVTIRRRTSDAWVADQIFACGEYRELLPFQPRTILDAGANIGLSSLWFAREFPEAHIVALEPDPENFELLVQNTIHEPRIRPRQAGLWSHPTRLSIADSAAEKYAFRVTEMPDTGQIEATSVGDICQENGWNEIDLLKMDIEGSEGVVLDASADWIDRVRAVIVELHPGIDSRCASRLFSAFAGRRFDLSWREENLILVQFQEVKEFS